MVRVSRGALVEYGLSIPPLALVFDFNPRTLSRTRTLTLRSPGTPGLRGAYDFALPTETPRVAQGVSVEPESFTLEILLDATDRMHEGDSVAATLGIQPELDTLRSLVEPKSQGPAGLQLLASLGLGSERAFQREQFASVLLFVWGGQVLPVFLTSVRVEETDFLPSLVAYRATASLTLQVIEGNNPFYLREKARQLVGAAVNTGRLSVDMLKGVL
ncbi:hypothetical protein JY651_48040 [Pyxidicoccus parkwayensis]|uniref:Lipoprotein n=1 Tax=Pyxidicoccus parkwayensis TaxID=2813578 RepID=A0ABX7NV34_9BACT|nr:hypothetical protein [Pyxidicoccus parkwaysis]QSQ22767.1 hypothetical protein JY651_48040 [Pyxidicoccus parkwaysis]